MGEHRLHACAALAPISKPRSPLVPRASSRTSRRRSIASQIAADYATRSGGVLHLSVSRMTRTGSMTATISMCGDCGSTTNQSISAGCSHADKKKRGRKG